MGWAEARFRVRMATTMENAILLPLEEEWA
jgi:hypothetical protein